MIRCKTYTIVNKIGFGAVERQTKYKISVWLDFCVCELVNERRRQLQGTMEPIDEIEYKENVERILQDFECNESICIDKVKCVAGCKDGDNYMSVVKRIFVIGKFNENEGADSDSRFFPLKP